MERTYKYSKVTGRILNTYNILISDGCKHGGWYRQLTSIESFVERLTDRWFDKHQGTGICVFNRDNGLEYNWCNINDIIGDSSPYIIKHYNFDSVWDFYEYIGYDYKNKSVKQLDNLILNWRD